MDADWSVEIGGDAPALEFPWRSPDPNGPRYVDLTAHPELLDSIEEAMRYPELREFLRAVNAASSPLQTVKCDVWSTSELSAEEEIYGGACKFGCYVDVICSDPETRFLFPKHEQLARPLVRLVEHARELPASAEFIVRRCYYHQNAEDVREGFYITIYALGYGKDRAAARQEWGIALDLIAKAVLQLSRSDEW